MKRREFLGAMASAAAAAPVVGSGGSPLAPLPLGKAEHCVMIWLGGGMAQIDTFDPKPMGDAKAKKAGGYYPAIDTAVPGVQVCEHLHRTAKLMDHITAVRTLHHNVVDEHAAATNRMHTGRPTSETVQYPSIGSIVAHRRGPVDASAPAYVLIGYPNLTRGPGFLGQKSGFVYLTDLQTGPSGLARAPGIDEHRQSRRSQFLSAVRQSGGQRFGDDATFQQYDQAIGESLRLSGPDFMSVFELDQETADLRQQYGSEFGQRCLLTRRLFQRGVRFVEVSHNMNFLNGTGWDTHNDGQLNQHLLIEELDTALSSLILDLQQHDMLDKTLIVINTEFGRPAQFDSGGGRGHYSKCFTAVLAGGGLNHCGAFGVSDELAMNVVEQPVSVPDFFATILATLGIDPTTNLFDLDRPVPITDGGRPIASLLS